MPFAAGEQCFGHVIPRLFIIKPHRNPPRRRVEIHHLREGDFGGAEVGLCAQGMRRVGEDQPGDRVAQQLCDLLFFPLRAVIVVHHQRLVTPRLGNGFDAGQQVGEDLVVEGGDQYADARSSAGLCGIGICDVQLPHDLRNAFGGVGRHFFRRAQEAADGHFGHAGQLRDVL